MPWYRRRTARCRCKFRLCTLNMLNFDNPTVVCRPLPEEPPRISAYTLYFQKLESLGYISATDIIIINICYTQYSGSIFIHLAVVASNKCELEQNFVKIWPYSSSKSSKVIDLGSNRKRIYDFLLVINTNLCPILYRFWDTATYWLKFCIFFLPLSYLASPLPMFPLEFCSEINHEETRVMGLLCGESCMILTSTVFDWSTHVTDRQMDGRAIAYICCRAQKLWQCLWLSVQITWYKWCSKRYHKM